MEALGHALTWRTACFINGGCGKKVFAHTNGYGDFVLLDQLGWPWPIHECYEGRFTGGIGQSRTTPYSGSFSNDWEDVRPVTPNIHGQKKFSIIGTVTNIEKGFVGKSQEFRNLTGVAEQEVKKSLMGRRSLITIVTGEGWEFTAFIDLEKEPIQFRNTVACDLKAVGLFNKSVFVVNLIRNFGGGS